MHSVPAISEAEFEVMKIIWEFAPITTNEVIEKLSTLSAWSPKTIQTLLIRLEKKGVIMHEKKSRVYIYKPLIEKEIYTAEKSQSFLKQFYNGTLNQMVVNLLDAELLSSNDIDELKELLDKAKSTQEDI